MAFQFLLDKIQNLAWQTKLFTIWPWLPLFHLFQPFASSNLIYFSPTEPRHRLRSLSDPSNSTSLQPPKAIKTLILPGLLLQSHLQAASNTSKVQYICSGTIEYDFHVTLISVSLSHEKPRIPSHPELQPVLSVWFIFPSSTNIIWHAIRSYLLISLSLPTDCKYLWGGESSVLLTDVSLPLCIGRGTL